MADSEAQDAEEISSKDWTLLLRRLKTKQCVPFLGAGASVSRQSNGQDDSDGSTSADRVEPSSQSGSEDQGVPAAGELAAQLVD